MILIRPYRESDLEGVLNTWEAASLLAHPFLSQDFMDQERENIARVYMPITDTWVAEVDSQVAGFIALMGNEVGAIFLQPACHGKGIGKALMDKAQSLHGELEVEVFEANTIGRRFYDDYGFELVDKKLHSPTGQSILRMRFSSATPSST